MVSNTSEYMKNYFKTHPEQYQKHKERIKIWQKNHQDLVKKWRKTALKNYYIKHPEKKINVNKRIKEHYRKLKQELVLALGGKCQKCGYNKCIEALEIHHLNPKDKEKKWETSMGHLNRRIIRKVIQLWKEGKVKLFCANCHREEETFIKKDTVIVS